MDTTENKKDIETRATSTGPRGTYIPIIANTLVPNLKDLIKPTTTSTGNFEAYKKVLKGLADAGFDGFIANIDYANISPTPGIREGYLRQILARAHDYGLFVIINNYSGSYGVKVPSQKWFDERADEVSKLKDKTDRNKVMVYENGYIDLIQKFITICKTTPGFGGVLLKDEPSLAQLEARYPLDNTDLSKVEKPQRKPGVTFDENILYSLPYVYNIVAPLLSNDEVVMVNLLPTTDKNTEYTQYLEAFFNIRGNGNHPKLWSYDFYPIKENNYLLQKELISRNPTIKQPELKKNGEISVEHTILYRDAKLFQYYANKSTETNKLPKGVFWYYCQSMSYLPTSPDFRPAATEPYLRFQIFSNLAMGCQGIMYWTYHQRVNTTELYLTAPINMQDRETAAWYYAKKINAEIKKYNAVFRNSILGDWGHVGQIYDNCQLLTGKLYSLSSVQITGKGVLVTSLSNNTGHYIVIVNHDVVNYQTITLTFDNTKFNTVELTGGPDPVKTLKTTLTPGGYVIFKWTYR